MLKKNHNNESFQKIHKKTPVVESFCSEVTCLNSAGLLKDDSNTVVFCEFPERLRTAASVIPVIKLPFSTKSKLSAVFSWTLRTTILSFCSFSLFYLIELAILAFFMQVFLLLRVILLPFSEEYSEPNQTIMMELFLLK